jgi:DNA-binding IclR family transcriptional regulator
VNIILRNKKIAGSPSMPLAKSKPPPRPAAPARPSAHGPNASLERYVIPNLRNACRVLKALRGSPGGLKAAELARDLGVPVTTTMRIMATLQIEGLVQKADGRYALGPGLIHLGNAALAGTDVRRLASPVLQQLTVDTGETSHLAIPCNERSLIIAVQDSLNPLRAASSAGFLTDLHSSSTGKIFLSHVFASRLGEIEALRSPYRHTGHTLTRRADLEREIELTRRRGYSIDDEECHIGVRCVAAPVFSSDGTVAAAIGITAPTLRLPERRIREVAEKVLGAASELSRLLGHAEPRQS